MDETQCNCGSDMDEWCDEKKLDFLYDTEAATADLLGWKL